MLYPLSASIPFCFQFTTGGAGATGLTVTVSVVRVTSAGVTTTIITQASNTAATEVDATNAKGLYRYWLAGASTGTEGVYLAVAHTAGTCDLHDVPALEIVGAAWVGTAAAAAAPSDVLAQAGTALTNYGALKPTTAGRTLDVSATGEAGIDLANVGAPTTTLNLSGTTISITQAVASVSGAVGSVTGAVGSVAGNVGGNVTGSVGSVATGGITAGSIAADAIGASELAADAVTKIAAGISIPTPPSAASIRVEMDTNSTKLDVAVGSRLAGGAYTAPDNAGIGVAASASVAAASAATSSASVTTKLNAMIEGSAPDYAFDAAALLNAPTGGGDAPTVEEIVDAVLDGLLAGHEITGSVAAALRKALLIGTAGITVSSPVAANGRTTIYAGYDMLAEDGMSLEYSIPERISGDLSGAIPHFITAYTSDEGINTTLDLTGTIDVDNRIARFQPRASDTASKGNTKSNATFDVYLHFADKDPVLVKSGVVNVSKKPL